MSQSICPSARLNAAENDEIQCREMRSYLTRVFCSPITFNYLNVGRLVLLLLLLLQGITDGQQKKDDWVLWVPGKPMQRLGPYNISNYNADRGGGGLKAITTSSPYLKMWPWQWQMIRLGHKQHSYIVSLESAEKELKCRCHALQCHSKPTLVSPPCLFTPIPGLFCLLWAEVKTRLNTSIYLLNIYSNLQLMTRT